MDYSPLHFQSLVADGHNDLLMLATHVGPARCAEHFGEFWLPKLRAGNVGLQVLPIFIDSMFQPEASLRQSLRMVETAYRIADAFPDDVAICTTGTAIDEAYAAGRIAFVLALEGCPQIGEDVQLLGTFARLGVRVVSFTHFGRTALADGSGEDATGGGLTRAGYEAVRLCNDLGVLIDVSHVGIASVADILRESAGPVVATHSASRALRDHHRNLQDEVLLQIAASGGVVGVNFFPGYLSAGQATVDTLVDHIAHIATVAGVDAVGLGSDFVADVFDAMTPPCDRPIVIEGVDGEATLPGLRGPEGLPAVTTELLARGYAEADVRKIIGTNWRRVLS